MRGNALARKSERGGGKTWPCLGRRVTMCVVAFAAPVAWAFMRNIKQEGCLVHVRL